MTMYHYTDVAALTNILEHNELWLTHTDFLNDSTEGIELYNYLCEEFKDNPHIIKLLDFVDRTKETYCVSFSKENNLLSQWRGYCPDSGGYNIGFKKDIFSSELNVIDSNENFVFQYPLKMDKESIDRNVEISCSASNMACIYTDKEKIEYYQSLTPIIEKAYADIVSWNEPTVNKFLNSDFELLSNTEVEKIKSTLQRNSVWFVNYGTYKYIYKNEAFKEEAEQRFFVTLRINSIKPFYRFKNNLSIPYLKLQFEPNIIKAITIGPCENITLAEKGLNHFIQNKSKLQSDSSSLLIVKSEIPFRSM